VRTATDMDDTQILLLNGSPSKNQSPLRWLMLLLAVMLILGPFYSFDNPGEAQLKS